MQDDCTRMLKDYMFYYVLVNEHIYYNIIFLFFKLKRLGPPAAHLLFTVVGFCYRWPWTCEQDSNLQLAPLNGGASPNWIITAYKSKHRDLFILTSGLDIPPVVYQNLTTSSAPIASYLFTHRGNLLRMDAIHDFLGIWLQLHFRGRSLKPTPRYAVVIASFLLRPTRYSLRTQ